MASVYLKRDTWYVQVTDALGRRRCVASSATTKTEAKRLALDMERRYERQRFGVEQHDLENGGGTVDELMEWWIETFLLQAASATGVSSIRKHIIGSALGQIRLTAMTPGKVDLFLTEKERVLSARSVNHLRGYLSRAFTMARRMERFPRPNPVADVPKRRSSSACPITCAHTKWFRFLRHSGRSGRRCSRPRSTRGCGRASCSPCGRQTSICRRG